MEAIPPPSRRPKEDNTIPTDPIERTTLYLQAVVGLVIFVLIGEALTTLVTPDNLSDEVNLAAMKSPRDLYHVTLATHLSKERIYVVDRLAIAWPGRIAVAFFSRTPEDTEAYNKLRSKWPDIDFVIVHKGNLDSSYPVNILRNKALDLVTKPYHFMIDGDFLPSLGLADYLEEHYFDRLEPIQNFTALVVPCFTASKRYDVPKTKAQLLEQWKKRESWPCGDDPADFNEYAHIIGTNYEYWRKATGWYEVKYYYPFEPYVVISTACTPRYDERFIYYGDDKVQYLAHLDYHRFHFIVLPDHFIIHVPHERGQWAVWDGERGEKIEKVQDIWERFKTETEGQPAKCHNPMRYQTHAFGIPDEPGERQAALKMIAEDTGVYNEVMINPIWHTVIWFLFGLCFTFIFFVVTHNQDIDDIVDMTQSAVAKVTPADRSQESGKGRAPATPVTVHRDDKPSVSTPPV